MTLHDFLKARGLSDAEMAARLGVTRQTVYRWRRGQAIPGREEMRALHQATGGEVTADDFYGLGPQAQPERGAQDPAA